MASQLREIRARITVETDCALEAAARASGKDRSEIMRDVLHLWALSKIHEHSVLRELLDREGVSAASEGVRAASQGS